ncbi:hypothetical protein [Zavarzinella formosa]|uniref:hypothetical protein n=1 Tax=Zavarzinella formosa TaxID=360055 RepID=UPI0002D4DD55|nr:hypothetical protein [Zavarzinella formosa]
MAYSEFSLRDTLDRFGLALIDTPDLFGDVPERQPSDLLTAILKEFLPLALAINTEKARSELVIAPLFAGLRKQLDHRFSIFSGIDFSVDATRGLAGYCDFILSRSPEQQFLESPVAVIAEAKNDNLKAGLGQCVAAMVAARLFNSNEGSPELPVFGAVTSGSLWRFMKLGQAEVRLDQREYHIRELPKLVGILSHMVGIDQG